MTSKYLTLALAGAGLGAALAATGASAHGFGGSSHTGYMGNPGNTMQVNQKALKVGETRTIVTTGNTLSIGNSGKFFRIADGRREWRREFFRWHHPRTFVQPLMLGPGPALPPR